MNRLTEPHTRLRIRALDAFLVTCISSMVLILVAIPFSGAVATAIVIVPTPPVPFTDMVLSASDTPDPVQSGDLLTYNIVASNLGPLEATNVNVKIDLPGGTNKPHVLLVSVTTDQGACGVPDKNLKLECGLGSVDTGDSVAIAIVLEVTDRAKGKLNMNSRVDASERDRDGANNRVKAVTTVQN